MSGRGPTEPRSSRGRLSADARGALWMLAGGMSMTIAHSTFKHLASELPFGVVIFCRHVIGTSILLAVFLGRGLGRGRISLHTSRFAGHFWRTLFGFSAYVTFVYALTRLSLADTVALSFTAPFWAALIAITVLRERVVPLRLLATLAGFGGVVLIAKPGGSFDVAMAVALLSAFMTSFAMLQVKQLSGSEGPDVITFYFMAIGIGLATPFALADWQTPSPRHLPYLLVIGGFSLMGQQFLTRGYSIGTFSKMAPMDFLRLPLSVAIGLAFFSEVPDLWSIVGMVVIGAASLAVVLSGRAPRPGAGR